MNHLERIPTEILASILGHLKRDDLFTCTLINKTIHREANRLYWNHLPLIEDKNVFSNIITIIMTTSLSITSSPPLGHYVRDVTLDEKLDDGAILKFVKQVPFLETLTLDRRVFTVDLQQIPKYCPHLKYLFVSLEVDHEFHQGPERNAIATPSLEFPTALSYCQQLTRLTLCNCYGLLGGALFSTLGRCASLEILELLNCDFVDLYDPKVVEIAAVNFVKCTKNLKKLFLNDNESHSIDYSPFMHDPCAWPHLVFLKLVTCAALTDQMAISFIQAHPHLQRLAIYQNRITDITLDAMAMYLPNITEINLGPSKYITGNGLRRLVENSVSSSHFFVLFRGSGLKVSDFPDVVHRCSISTQSDLHEGDNADAQFLTKDALSSGYIDSNGLRVCETCKR